METLDKNSDEIHNFAKEKKKAHFISQAPWKYHISTSMNITSIIVLILKWLAISVEYMFFLCGDGI